MNETALAVLLIIVALAALIFLPQWRGRRAVAQVINIFRMQGATDSKHAKTAPEMGLAQQTMLIRLLSPRDYKQDALKALIKAGVIQVVANDRMYLVENKLLNTRFDKRMQT